MLFGLTVSKWEKGLSIPDADVLIEMAELAMYRLVNCLELRGVSIVMEIWRKVAELNEQLARKSKRKVVVSGKPEKRV